MKEKILDIVEEYIDFEHFIFVHINKEIYKDIINSNFRTWLKICLIPLYIIFFIVWNFVGILVSITCFIISIIQILCIPFSYIKFPKIFSNIWKLFYKN